MKRLCSLILAGIISILFFLPLSYAADHGVFSGEQDGSDGMNALQRDISREYPGLRRVDASKLDPTLPVITINSLDELHSLMSGLNSSYMFKRQPVRMRRPRSYIYGEPSVLSKYPGLKEVAPDLLDPSLPIIELENHDELDNFMKGLSSAHLYGK